MPAEGHNIDGDQWRPIGHAEIGFSPRRHGRPLAA